MAKHTAPCGKRFGSGKIRAFMHIADGKCFACCGNGTIEIEAVRCDGIIQAPRSSELELRNMYRAARSQVVSGWTTAEEWLEDGTGARLASYIADLPADRRVRAEAEFGKILGSAWKRAA
jgi:hypothetical protein